MYGRLVDMQCLWDQLKLPMHPSHSPFFVLPMVHPLMYKLHTTLQLLQVGEGLNTKECTCMSITRCKGSKDSFEDAAI